MNSLTNYCSTKLIMVVWVRFTFCFLCVRWNCRHLRCFLSKNSKLLWLLSCSMSRWDQALSTKVMFSFQPVIHTMKPFVTSTGSQCACALCNTLNLHEFNNFCVNRSRQRSVKNCTFTSCEGLQFIILLLRTCKVRVTLWRLCVQFARVNYERIQDDQEEVAHFRKWFVTFTERFVETVVWGLLQQEIHITHASIRGKSSTSFLISDDMIMMMIMLFNAIQHKYLKRVPP